MSEYTQKADLLKKAAEAYYNQDSLLMTDGEYDSLFAEVEAAEVANPEWAVDGGVSTDVAAGVGLAGGISHHWPMLSLRNTYDADEVAAFTNRLPEGAEFLVEAKFDGVAASVRYIDGVRTVIASRGDGRTGEDYSNASVTIAGLPEVIPGLTGEVEIRGEIILNEAQFLAANEVRVEHGKEPFANKRNGASGAMRATGRPYTIEVGFYGYDVKPEVPDMHQWLIDHGVQTREVATVPASGVADALDDILAASALDDIPMDGAVIKVADLGLREGLGFGSRFPHWAVAYKFPIREVQTRLEDVEWATGRTGVVTPRARVTPTHVMGSTVTYSTLHNIKYIRDRNLMIGDTILLYKAGYVIPRISGRLDVPRTGTEREIVIPTHCPSCEAELTLTDTQILRCTNKDCDNAVRTLVHAAARGALDVDGLGECLITQLVDVLGVARLDELFGLTVDDISELDRMGPKSAQKVIGNLEAARSASLEQYIPALNLRQAGKTLAGELGAVAGSLSGLLDLTPADLIGKVRSVGELKSETIIASIQQARPTIEGLVARGINPVSNYQAPEVVEDGVLSGKVVVVTGKATGTLAGLGRDEVKARLVAAGATVANSVTGKVNLVIAGEGGGSKRAKAEEKGIEIISFEEFDAL